ncbi:thioredoxin peroxidase dot5 [Emydomyces testavorans]|uniref:thioredoxin-dependent peroxiredoxin n=1 Tax=Emydomyces testavorans TaxID=2070801 RepID=A0AAF0DG58_9EURO|nr:thioredoxin peroxidase dot5 [Emydomyces testavorans]
MPMELRKRKAPAEPKGVPVARKKVDTKASARKVKASKNQSKETKKSAPSSSAEIPTVGTTLDLDQYQDEVHLQDGTSSSLKALVESSKNGVVLFTYPKASTPGCTRQACLFRDGYDHLSSTGLSIYGLSTDSPNANTKFKEKQNLPYPLVCDPSAKLIGAIGLKKQPKGTIRGVFAVDKAGKVLLLEAGKPEATVALVEELVAGKTDSNEA